MTDTQPPLMGRTGQALLLTVAAMFCFAAMSTAVRALADEMPTTQMVFLRNVLSFVIVSTWMVLRFGHIRFVHTTKHRGHFWRAGLGFLAMEIWFYSLSIMKLTTATALSFTTPIFATIFAMFILKEKAGWRRWAAIAVGFAGVLIILRPGTEALALSSCIVLISSALMACAGIVVKTLTKTEPPETIVFYMALFMTPLSLPFGLIDWQPITERGFLLILLIAFFSTSAHLIIARAYMRAEMVTLLPLDFTRLLFTAAFAYFLFNEQMDHYTLTGAAIIVASAVYIVHRETVRRKSVTKS